MHHVSPQSLRRERNFDSSEIIRSSRPQKHLAHLFQELIRKLDVPVDSASQAHRGLIVPMKIRPTGGNEIEFPAQFEVETGLRRPMFAVIDLDASHPAIGQSANQPAELIFIKLQTHGMRQGSQSSSSTYDCDGIFDRDILPGDCSFGLFSKKHIKCFLHGRYIALVTQDPGEVTAPRLDWAVRDYLVKANVNSIPLQVGDQVEVTPVATCLACIQPGAEPGGGRRIQKVCQQMR